MSARARRIWLAVAGLWSALVPYPPVAGAEAPPAVALERLSLPQGFSIRIWARVPGARSLAVAEDGARVYVGTAGSEVFAILDPDRDGLADEVITVAGELDAPNGVAVGRDGALFVAERHRILRLQGDGLGNVVVPAGVLPGDPTHGLRYAAFGPDGRLYVAIGAPCDLCEGRSFAGTIIRMQPDGHELRIFARGIRDVQGFDWHPITGQMFFTDAAAGQPGDAATPHELNLAHRRGLHFGPPHARAPDGRGQQPRERMSPVDPVMPVLELEAGMAPSGIDFYEGGMFPASYRHDALIARHGSRDPGEPPGHRIVRVRFDGDLPVGEETFIEDWLDRGGAVFGRPVDLEELPDGSLLISDDVAGLVYRVTYLPPPGDTRREIAGSAAPDRAFR
jgi:glucose/arabinose dehydrogenase